MGPGGAGICGIPRICSWRAATSAGSVCKGMTTRARTGALTTCSLAAAAPSDVERLVVQTGFFRQKTKAIIGMAHALLEAHAGAVPADMDALTALPGVGRKTANVVLSQGFGRPALAVDTHIHRLAARWGLSRGKTPDHTERDLCRLFPESRWNSLHLQMIYFGREHCPALYHELATCPICYRTTDDDGRLPSLADRARRLDLHAHITEHDSFPVGDDEWLESLRRGDRIRVGRFEAPFDLVRRYLVTGIVDAGRLRATRHDAIVTAMTQLARWGRDAVPSVGDTEVWREARNAMTAVMERYHHRRA